MHAGPDRPEREVERPDSRAPADRHPRRVGEPDNARRVTLTVALVVTFLFLLVTAGGIGWFLANGTGNGTGPGEDTASDGTAGETEPTTGSGPPPGGEGTVTDSRAGLAYLLPGEGWARLGDDQVPAEYSSYTVYGSEDDPDAIIVTGTEDLGPLEPIAATGLSLATEMVGELVTGGADLRIEPSGETTLDDRPAFGATLGDASDEDGGYGRFLVVQVTDDRGAFMLGLNTSGGEDATAGIDTAFDSLGTV
ncbi:hypothetical protein [Nocardiopsis sp. L17-MgMaSL7]|uniref:hypothetical protein n=1 Tax=Nocardiopsis sp. L17-MgMaSL7 TaxID=1938893 RepID=UPI000D9662D4|nr:hypothetical protein [Nocardiopsis sp. L17-MgMaSL7]PWV45705.1 hypothetical protein BDW27_11639 [Nocardiopsis sp. L17-MgMaSL7]